MTVNLKKAQIQSPNQNVLGKKDDLASGERMENDCLNRTQKAVTMKEKSDELGLIKI